MSQAIERQLGAILDEYKEVPKQVVEKCSRKAARSAAQKLRSTSPSLSGEYASNWSTRKYGKGYVVYNKKPGLTHLLERGHDVYNAYGRVGRAPTYVHIAPVAEEYKREYVESVERELKK